jgi:hypothetical protein
LRGVRHRPLAAQTVEQRILGVFANEGDSARFNH